MPAPLRKGKPLAVAVRGSSCRCLIPLDPTSHSFFHDTAEYSNRSATAMALMILVDGAAAWLDETLMIRGRSLLPRHDAVVVLESSS